MRFYRQVINGLLVALVLAALMCPSGALAQDGGEGEEPEEPDFFFLTGGPYTQKKNSPQIIWGQQWFRTTTLGLVTREVAGAGRFEWGLTDRWEADFEFGFAGAEQTFNGISIFDANGAADLLVGIRYRLLDESFAPFTLTLGPQVIFPAASRLKGLGTGETGYAVDVTAAKDWGGPVFVAVSVNGGFTPSVPANADGTGQEFDLSGVAWAAALGIRALERDTDGGTNHDVHLFLEVSGSREEELEAGLRLRSTPWQLAPGVRYGYMSRNGSLAEIGVSVPVGLNDEAPDWGVIVQFQFEWASIGGN
jgi:hypothetical protein